MVSEARIVSGENGLVPDGQGWFVLNAREARWWHTEDLGSAVTFEGDAGFPEYGVNIQVLGPGQPNCMYHGEDAQEDFLVLAGECLLLIEGEERELAAWDFVHCPAWTEHVFVGAGTGPSAILMIGARGGDRGLIYPVVDIARKHEAGVTVETPSPEEAYASYGEMQEGPYREGLPAV